MGMSVKGNVNRKIIVAR
jgi:hypothetical protein